MILSTLIDQFLFLLDAPTLTEFLGNSVTFCDEDATSGEEFEMEIIFDAYPRPKRDSVNRRDVFTS
jgi:hypothetical protein